MKTSALQEFLRSLGGSLAAVGVQPKSLEDLRAVASGLESFRDLDLEQLADFLKRAAAFRQSGDVPAVAIPGLDDATSSARELGDTLQALSVAEDSEAAELEKRITQGKHKLQTALGTLTKEFGVGLKFTDDKKWLPTVRAKSQVSRVTESFRRLVPQLTGPESYQSESVTSAVEELAATDGKVLKAVAAELGVSASGSGKKFVEAVLAKLSGIEAKPAKAAKSKKASGPEASAEQVEEMVTALQNMVTRAKDPKAVPDSEIEAILTRLSNDFSNTQQKEIAQRVTGEKVSGKGAKAAEDARARLRAELTAVKRLVESQNV